MTRTERPASVTPQAWAQIAASPLLHAPTIGAWRRSGGAKRPAPEDRHRLAVAITHEAARLAAARRLEAEFWSLHHRHDVGPIGDRLVDLGRRLQAIGRPTGARREVAA